MDKKCRQFFSAHSLETLKNYVPNKCHLECVFIRFRAFLFAIGLRHEKIRRT